jgi:hypothetical protein
VFGATPAHNRRRGGKRAYLTLEINVQQVARAAAISAGVAGGALIVWFSAGALLVVFAGLLFAVFLRAAVDTSYPNSVRRTHGHGVTPTTWK